MKQNWCKVLLSADKPGHLINDFVLFRTKWRNFKIITQREGFRQIDEYERFLEMNTYTGRHKE